MRNRPSEILLNVTIVLIGADPSRTNPKRTEKRKGGRVQEKKKIEGHEKIMGPRKCRKAADREDTENKHKKMKFGKK